MPDNKPVQAESSVHAIKETAAPTVKESIPKRTNGQNIPALLKKLQFNKKDALLTTYMIIPCLFVLIGISWALTFLLKSSTIIKDYSYILFTSIIDVPDHILIQLITKLKITVWDILLAAHGGKYQGHLALNDIGEGPFYFQLKLPVIIAPILLVIVFICVIRILKSKLSLTKKQCIKVSILGSAAYAIILVIIMKVMEPSYQTGDLSYAVTTSSFQILLQAFLIMFIASFIGFQLWRLEKVRSHALIKPIISLKPFARTLIAAVIVVGVLIIVMWSLVHPSSIFFKPLTTPTSIWMMYKGDPMIYLLIPTFLFGELLYATGGSFAISNPMVGELLQASEPFRLHLLTGLSALDGAENEQFLLAVKDAAQFSWYTMAFLLIFLLSFHRVKEQSLKNMLISIGFIGIGFMVMAQAVTLSLTTSDTSGYIGFSAIGSGFAVSIICTLFYAVKHFLLKKRTVSKVGDRNE